MISHLTHDRRSPRDFPAWPKLIIAAVLTALLAAATATAQTPCRLALPDSMVRGTSVQARVYGCAGDTIATNAGTWSPVNGTRVSVSATGRVTASSSNTGATDVLFRVGQVIVGHTVTVTALSATTVTAVVVSPHTCTLTIGQTCQLSALANIATTFQWGSRNAGVATVSQSGLVTAIGAGSAWVGAASPNLVLDSAQITVTASAPAPAPTPAPTPAPAPGDTGSSPGAPAPSGAVDPTLLPVALPNMAMNVAAYTALNVRGLAAGQSYRDPVTNVRVTRLTSATFPAAGNWGLPYFESGWAVSLPLDSLGTRSVLAYNGNGGSMLLDVIPGRSVSRARAFPSGANPTRDLCFSFSTNPATPWIAYVLNGSQLVKLDTRTMTVITGGGFPVAGAGDGGWLQQSEGDTEFAWLANGTAHHFTPATGAHLTRAFSPTHAIRFSRSGRYIGVAIDNNNGLTLWDTQTGATWNGDGEAAPFAHNATLKDLWIGSAWNSNYPFGFTSTGVVAGSQRAEWAPSVGGHPTGNGGWLQAGDQRNAWTVWNSYGSLAGCDAWCSLSWTAPGGIVLVTLNGGAAKARLVAHPYSNQTGGYWDEAWPVLSADGGVVAFASDMLGSGRWDMFLAELPRKP